MKIGISGKASKRRTEVDKSAPGIDFIFWNARLPYAYNLEQSIHKLCRALGLQASFSGSGHTERFYFPAAIIYFVFVFLAYVAYYTFHLAIVALIIWALFLVEGKNHQNEETKNNIHNLWNPSELKRGNTKEGRPTTRDRLLKLEK